MDRVTGDADGRKHVYLAGAIEFAPDGGRAWRRDMAAFLQDELGLPCYDPCVEEMSPLTPEERAGFRHWKSADRPRFLPVIRRIIDQDLDMLLQRTQFVVCLWDEHARGGAGTAGELTLAYRMGIPVYMVLAMPPASASSWILGCATEVFADFDALKAYLRMLHDDSC
ncbi:MAG: hypothetical protein N2111_00705 [Candidatus Sumerlaeaceae bacterium]|nr:hypothetical protein [Candidatus Sumerlaeaceae bacterium]